MRNLFLGVDPDSHDIVLSVAPVVDGVVLVVGVEDVEVGVGGGLAEERDVAGTGAVAVSRGVDS